MLNLSDKVFLEKRLFFSVIIVVISLLSACRSAPALPTETPISVAATPASTATTLPTNASPTSVVAAQIPLKSYTHPTNRFSLSYPETWKFFERPDGVILLEPTAHAGYSVIFSDAGEIYSEQELNQYMVTFVAQNFAGEGSNFQPINQERQPDGTLVAEFAWTDPNLGPTISELQIIQQDTIVFMLHINTAAEQWPVSRTRLQALIETFKPIDTSPGPEAQPTEELPVWTLIGPDNKEFGFFYASDWEILEQTKSSVSVALPKDDFSFTAENFTWPDAAEDSEAAEKAALAHIETLTETYQAVQHLPPAEFPLATATGATIDFVYTTADGASMAGSVITAVHKGKMYKIVFTAPADIYEAALHWFNPMYKSFTFLSPEDAVVGEP
jgi:hypothetical protein